jgi:hypothetical protein
MNPCPFFISRYYNMICDFRYFSSNLDFMNKCNYNNYIVIFMKNKEPYPWKNNYEQGMSS